MLFDWTVNVGHILTIVGMLGTIVALYFALRTETKLMGERMITLAGRMINVENEIKELTKVTIELAKTDEQFKSVDARMNGQADRLNELTVRVNRWMDGRDTGGLSKR